VDTESGRLGRATLHPPLAAPPVAAAAWSVGTDRDSTSSGQRSSGYIVAAVSSGSALSEQAARAAFADRDWDGVLVAAGEALGAAGAPAELRRLRGWAHYHLGRYGEGLEDFTQALRLEPAMTDAALGRGRCHRMLGAVDDAAADFALAHELSPQDPHPLCERGAVLILDERWAEALADYRAAEALNPEHPGLASYFAELHLYSGHPGEALEAARQGLKREPDSVMHRVNLAHALLFMGRREEALAQYAAIRERMVRGEHVSGAAIVLTDLRLMREAGLTCEGFDEVEAMMGGAGGT
jgi:tetratricopeptide (TPR) repeat protein